MNTIFKIIRIFTIILYLIMNLVLVHLIFTNTQYFSITEKTTFQNTMLLFSVTLLAPAILISILFIKKNNIILKKVKYIILFILLIFLPRVFILGGIISLRMPSSTTNPANYDKREVNVDELLEHQEFTIFPKTLPENILNVDYFYKYEAIFDDNYLTLDVSWTYKDESDYQNDKFKMQSYETINHQTVENGLTIVYVTGNNMNDNQRFCFGYDDDKKRIVYRIYYEWI